jgi:hypothetical protein
VKRHFDAWGQPILDIFGMLNYYAGDGKSMSIVRNFPPYKYVALPKVEIVIPLPFEGIIEVKRTWPAASTHNQVICGSRVINALRSQIRRPGGHWIVLRASQSITMVLPGRAIKAKWCNYGGMG